MVFVDFILLAQPIHIKQLKNTDFFAVLGSDYTELHGVIPGQKGEMIRLFEKDPTQVFFLLLFS